jgi:hypothetical protein
MLRMNTIGAIWVGLALLLGLVACVPESRHPLSDPETATIDERLVGLWAGRFGEANAYLHFLPRSEGEMEIIAVSRGVEGESGWSVFTTVSGAIGETWYMSVKGRLDDGEPWREGGGGFFLCRYRISAEGELLVWMLGAEAAVAAIAGGLGGRVEKGRFFDDIEITASTAELAAYLATADPKKLFTDPIGSFRRVE